MRSPRRIRLAFREAALGDIRIAPQLEAALAPAALPRTWLTHRLLLAIKEVRGLLGGKALTLLYLRLVSISLQVVCSSCAIQTLGSW